jgi:hypothetical protein
MNWRNSLLLIFTFSSLCGCPTRQQPTIPPPKPPDPQTSPVPDTPAKEKDVSFGWRQLELLGGMAPLVGPAPYFVQMLASQQDFNEKKLPL